MAPKQEANVPTPNVPTPQPAAAIDYLKAEGFRSEYANNTFLEHSAWDLKFVFGQLDQSISPTTVIQHTGISMPWNQVKILAYFLQIHLATYETLNGRIKIPTGVVNPVPPPDDEMAKTYPSSVDVYQVMQKLYEQFMEENPEAAPKSV